MNGIFFKNLSIFFGLTVDYVYFFSIELGQNPSEEELIRMINEVDSSGKGAIGNSQRTENKSNYNEFLYIKQKEIERELLLHQKEDC